MPSVSVLYISDEIVGPHLELLRNICEPRSRSRPHVTVRYFNKLSVPENHLQTKVRSIDIIEPDSFGFDYGDKQENRTIFLRCQSDDLLALEHKPYFPTSELHITLYDGVDEGFARSLLDMLGRFSWGFRLQLPQNSSLSEIKIRTKKRSDKPQEFSRVYAPSVCELYFNLFSESLTFEVIDKMTSVKKLERAELICVSLSNLLRKFERVTIPQRQPKGSVGPEPSDDLIEVHLTPPELAESMAKYAVSFLDDRRRIDFGDPAVGTGAFFAALTQVVQRKFIKSAIGIDVSRKQVKAARWKWAGKGMEVIEGDYLHLDRLSPRNLILANPPYMRHQGIPSEYKKELRERASVAMGMRVSGLSGQYVYFLLLSHRWMVPGAVAAWLIPSEFMRSSYGASIRKYLSEKVTLLRIHQFDHKDRQFENAEVLPSIVVFKNVAPVNGGEAVFSIGGGLESPEFSQNIALAELQGDEKWLIPRRNESRVKLKRREVSVGDLFSVRRGIATGANNFFILERREAHRLQIPEKFLRPIMPKIRNLHDDVIYSDPDGYPSVEEQFCVIDCSLPEDEVRALYPQFWSYLAQGVADGILGRYMVGRRRPWYKQERRDPAPFLCTYMGKATEGKPAIRFVWNQSEAIATNTYLMLYPKPNLTGLMQKNKEIIPVVFDALKTAAADTAIDFYRFYAGGLSKIEPRELEQVKFPGLPDLLRLEGDNLLI